MASHNSPLLSVAKLTFGAILTAFAIAVLWANLDIEDGKVELRNFDIAIHDVESGQVPDCSMNITGTELVNGTYPPVEWSGSSDQEGRIRGWLKPGNYLAAISCTDGYGNETVIPSTISVSFWGRAEISVWGSRGNARSAEIELPNARDNSASQQCDCAPVTTEDPVATPELPNQEPAPVADEAYSPPAENKPAFPPDFSLPSGELFCGYIDQVGPALFGRPLMWLAESGGQRYVVLEAPVFHTVSVIPLQIQAQGGCHSSF